MQRKSSPQMPVQASILSMRISEFPKETVDGKPLGQNHGADQVALPSPDGKLRTPSDGIDTKKS